MAALLSPIVLPFAVRRVAPARGRATVAPRAAAFSQKSLRTFAPGLAKRVTCATRRRDPSAFAASSHATGAGAAADDNDDEALDASDGASRAARGTNTKQPPWRLERRCVGYKQILLPSEYIQHPPTPTMHLVPHKAGEFVVEAFDNEAELGKALCLEVEENAKAGGGASRIHLTIA
jgi:hypothetical protein